MRRAQSLAKRELAGVVIGLFVGLLVGLFLGLFTVLSRP
jgi:ABC-type nitrate/sulfonate/bicarbonate transport system permease component